MQWVEERGRKPVCIWLWFVAFMIMMMVVIGGLTRLTDSGLSMVEWDVIGGTIPPLTDAEWQEAFDKYRQFPEYQLTRKGMEMDEFKFIFFMEWFHRVWGRLIGLVFFFPMIYFTFISKVVHKRFFGRLFFLFCLGGLQGFVGWLMVKSGLVDKPHVSHYKLTLHLSLALVSLSFSLWYAWKLTFPPNPSADRILRKMRTPAVIVAVLLALQIMGGAMVAGLHAGHSYNTFPKMLGYWMPKEVWAYDSVFRNFIDNPVMLQFIHRWWAMVVTIAILATVAIWQSHVVESRLRWGLWLMAGLVCVQVGLGIATLLMLVPISLASMHQITGVLLWCTVLFVVHRTYHVHAHY
jgi:cytochrome c oxidase assembly protein subunit 15